MINRMIEIGVATADLKRTGDQLSQILGAQPGPVINGSEFGMRAQMFRVGNIEFELMEPVTRESLIAAFLETRGEGLHHLAFQVENIEQTIVWMKQRGLKMIHEKPISIEGFKAAFVHPVSLGGVLVELIEGEPMWVDHSFLPEELRRTEPVKGVGAEGLLEVGILLPESTTAEEVYSKVFPSRAVSVRSLSGAKAYRAGNVSLHLIESGNQDVFLSLLPSSGEPGLKYVILQVTDLEAAIFYLNENRISFDKCTDAGSRFLFVYPKDLSGLPVFLTHET
ncbi:MAG: VOC family protein [Thermodesulfobacteriota bacterium]